MWGDSAEPPTDRPPRLASSDHEHDQLRLDDFMGRRGLGRAQECAAETRYCSHTGGAERRAMRRLIIVVVLVVGLLVATATAAFAPKRYSPPTAPQSVASLIR